MSWEVKTIGEVCTLEKGNIGITKAVAGEYPLVVLGEERRTHNEFQFDDEAVIIPLVSSTGHGHRSMKRIHFQSGKFSVGNILCAVIPKDKTFLSAQFLYRYLDLNKENELVSRMKGMANVSLPMKSIAEVEIPIPPLEVQHEIVSKFYAIEASNNDLMDEHIHQLDLLKKLRQQILQDAVQGKLVSQNPNDEPANKLLEKIKAEKELLIQKKKIKKEKPLPEIKPEEIPFDIPDSWAWCKLGQISESITDGVHYAPNYISSGIPSLSAKDIYNNKINLEKCNYVSNEEYLAQKDKFRLRTGSILVTKSGSIGRTAVFEGDIEIYLVESVGVINCATRFIHSKFIKCFIDSVFDEITYKGEHVKGIGVKHLTLTLLSKMLMPLPPFSEQIRIATKIDQLMTLCNELEQSIQQNQKYTQELLQVALKEALETPDRKEKQY